MPAAPRDPFDDLPPPNRSTTSGGSEPASGQDGSPPSFPAPTPAEMATLLDPPSHEMDYFLRLELAQRYVRYCAECLIPDRPAVVDPARLMIRFEEVFIAVRDLVDVASNGLLDRIESLEEDQDLCQKMVRLGIMATDRLVEPTFMERLFPTVSRVSLSSPVEISLQPDTDATLTRQGVAEAKTTCIRLSGLLGAAARNAKRWWLEAQDVVVIDGVYDPRRVSPLAVAARVARVRDSVVASRTLPDSVKEAVLRELAITANELSSPKPSWNKIFSRLAQIAMVLAALTGICADAKDAYDNIVETIQYISAQAGAWPQGVPPPALPPPAPDEPVGYIPPALPGPRRPD